MPTKVEVHASLPISYEQEYISMFNRQIPKILGIYIYNNT